MPKPTGVLHNGYRLKLNGEFIGYFKTQQKAQFVVRAIEFYQNTEYLNEMIEIEPWFIEGEF